MNPGEILRNDLLEPLGLTAYRLAKQLGVSRPMITQIVARRRGVTVEMALTRAVFRHECPSLAKPAVPIRSGSRHDEDRKDRHQKIRPRFVLLHCVIKSTLFAMNVRRGLFRMSR